MMCKGLMQRILVITAKRIEIFEISLCYIKMFIADHHDDRLRGSARLNKDRLGRGSNNQNGNLRCFFP